VLLIVTLPIQTHAVKLDMPAPNATPPTVIPETVELGVDFDGTITWNGATVDRSTMDAYFEDAAKKNPQPEIHINANRLAKYDAVAKVLADAQRLGATHIGFTGIDQYN
jgi:biopolymer transport protein ExbD